MPLLSAPIPPQNFEVVRDRLGAILADELANQFILLGQPTNVIPTVWLERSTAVDKSEMPYLIVSLAQGSYDNGSPISVDGTYRYTVDVFTQAKTGSAGRGDTRALMGAHRILGLVRYILMASEYQTLGVLPPFSSTVKVSEFRIGEPSTEQESANAVQSRLEVEVRIAEANHLGTSRPITESLTHVKLYDTDKGYYYGFAPPVPGTYAYYVTAMQSYSVPPDNAAILTWDEVAIPQDQTKVITFPSDSSMYLGFAYPKTLSDPTDYYINAFDFGKLGTGGTFGLPIEVGDFKVILSNYPTQIAGPVTFTTVPVSNTYPFGFPAILSPGGTAGLPYQLPVNFTP